MRTQIKEHAKNIISFKRLIIHHFFFANFKASNQKDLRKMIVQGFNECSVIKKKKRIALKFKMFY